MNDIPSPAQSYCVFPPTPHTYISSHSKHLKYIHPSHWVSPLHTSPLMLHMCITWPHLFIPYVRTLTPHLSTHTPPTHIAFHSFTPSHSTHCHSPTPQITSCTLLSNLTRTWCTSIHTCTQLHAGPEYGADIGASEFVRYCLLVCFMCMKAWSMSVIFLSSCRHLRGTISRACLGAPSFSSAHFCYGTNLCLYVVHLQLYRCIKLCTAG